MVDFQAKLLAAVVAAVLCMGDSPAGSALLSFGFGKTSSCAFDIGDGLREIDSGKEDSFKHESVGIGNRKTASSRSLRARVNLAPLAPAKNQPTSMQAPSTPPVFV